VNYKQLQILKVLASQTHHGKWAYLPSQIAILTSLSDGEVLSLLSGMEQDHLIYHENHRGTRYYFISGSGLTILHHS